MQQTMTREQAVTTLVAHNNLERLAARPDFFDGRAGEARMQVSVRTDIEVYRTMDDEDVIALAQEVTEQ